MMGLSDKQTEDGKRFSIISLFMSYLHKKNYAIIQKFYELTQVGNTKLLERFHQKRQVGLFSTDQIYMDIIYIILDEIINNRETENIFLETYKELMPDVYAKAEEAVRIGQRGEVFQPFLMKESKSKNERQWFYRYLLYEFRAWDLVNPEAAVMMANSDANSYWRQYILSESDILEKSGHEMTFSDTDESIFESPMFAKMIRKRRNEISEALGIDESQLDYFIHRQIQLRAEYGTVETTEYSGSPNYAELKTGKGFPGILNLLTMSLIAKHGGGNDWLAFMTNDVTGVYVQKKYKPNVAELITEYYKSLVIDKYNECEEKGVAFTKIFLSRECKSANIYEDINGIYMAYEIDVLSQMMMYIFEDYYRNFSWEQITENRSAERYNVIINQLKSIIDEKDKQLHRMGEANAVLRLQTSSNNDEAIIQISRKNDELSKCLEEKDNEIRKLKETIESYEAFIRELETEEACEDEDINIEDLQTKRYLFVGNIGSDFDELKRLFPSSVFMTNNTMSLSGISVDAIVMVIKRMSHSMYYKVKASSLYQESPCVKSNAIKSEGVISDIWNQLVI